MTAKELLMDNLNNIHTTELGVERINKNLKLDKKVDVVDYCKNKIKDKKSEVYREGKNYYIINGSLKFTINASSFTIITAHII